MTKKALFQITIIWLVFSFQVNIITAYEFQDPVYYPVSSDLILKADYNSSDIPTISLINLYGEIINFVEITGWQAGSSFRSIQYLGDQTYFVDAKTIVMHIKVLDKKVSLTEQREVPFNTDNLEDFFYFFHEKHTVRVRYLHNDIVKVEVYNSDKLVFTDQSSFNVKNDNFENGEYVRFTYVPNENEISLTSRSNNVWITVEEQKMVQRFYGILPSGRKGKISRWYDHINQKKYLIINDNGRYTVFQLDNYHRISLLRDDRYLLGTTDKKPSFIIDGCIYSVDITSDASSKNCFQVVSLHD